mmetsp:Transcript_4428/g.13438  ORF Transcript_4428/g.13438 Transcript_4428/m.13438 type:complete len:130 (-) Transcript_4428:552-941(-)
MLLTQVASFAQAVREKLQRQEFADRDRERERVREKHRKVRQRSRGEKTNIEIQGAQLLSQVGSDDGSANGSDSVDNASVLSLAEGSDSEEGTSEITSVDMQRDGPHDAGSKLGHSGREALEKLHKSSLF